MSIQLTRIKRTYRWIPITDKTQITLALLGNACFVGGTNSGCQLNRPESYPCIIADSTFRDGPRIWKPVPNDYVGSDGEIRRYT